MANLSPMDALRNLEKLYQHGFRDSVTDAALIRVAYSQAARDETVLRDIERDLKEFEDQYKMASGEFHQQWDAGELPDSADFTDWNALYQMANEIRQRLSFLRGG